MCLGRTHTVGGMLAGLTVAAVDAAWFDVVPVAFTPAVVAAFAVAAGGAAQLNDLDCPGSVISRGLGPVTMALARFVTWVVRRHRGPTHYLVAVPVFALIAWVFSELRWGVFVWPARLFVRMFPDTPVFADLAYLFDGPWRDLKWGMFVLLALLSAWGLRMLSDDLDHALLGAGEIVAGVLFAWWATATLEPGSWVFWAVAVGVLAHDLADLFTKGSFKFLWPLPWKIAFGWFTTGQRVEKLVVAPLFTVAALTLTVHLVVMPTWRQVEPVLVRPGVMR